MSKMRRRRSFLQALAAAPLLPAALTGGVSAQTAPAPPHPSPSPSPSSSPGGTAPGPVAEALGEAARARFGRHLTPADVTEIKKLIQGNLETAERLRAVTLGNADEPVTVFEAVPRPARRRGEVSTGRGGRPVRRLPEREN